MEEIPMDAISFSGLDLNSIVTASVQAKTTSMNSGIQNKIQTYNNSLSGLGKLSSYMSSFSDSLQTKDNFNVNKTLTEGSGKNDLYGFDVETTKDANEDQFNIKVKQVAEKAKTTYKFSRDFTDNFHSGTIDFDLGDNKRFSITVNSGDSLVSIRRNINENNPYGVSASLVNSSSGYVLTLNYDYDFDVGFNGDLANDIDAEVQKQNAKPAIIEVNGNEIQSDTNDFDQIEGLKIHANFVSEGNVQISKDKKSQDEQINDFVNNFNNLINQLDGLSKRDTYTDGKSNNDGGLLAGNSSIRRIKDDLKNTIGNQFNDLGLSFDRHGKLQYKETEMSFSEKQAKIEEMFKVMKDSVDKYLEDDSIISKQKEQINDSINDANSRLERNNVYIEKYKEMITKKYSKLDGLLSASNAQIQMLNNLFN
jgi:flagellar hook-associated protein 2